MPEPPPGPPAAPSAGVPLPSRLRRFLAFLASWEERLLLVPLRPGVAGRPLRFAQVVLLAGRRYREDHAGDRAAALAFATLLSMVPLLLLGLAVFGAAGVTPETLQRVRHWLLETFVPETARSFQDSMESTLVAIEQARHGFGTAGVVILVLTGWKLLATLQRTFEQIWGVKDFASRLRRVVAFWAAVLLAPFLVLGSLFLSGMLETVGVRGEGWFTVAANYLLPAIPGWVGVLVTFRYCAGKRTTWRAAVAGAAVSALLWEFLKLGFAVYVRKAVVLKTVLAGMGVVPVFLLWVYFSWVAFLLGAELAFVLHDYDGALRRGGILPPATSGVPADPRPAP